MLSPRLTIRIGCCLVYEAVYPTPILLVVRPRISYGQSQLAECLTVDPFVGYDDLMDWQGNSVQRWELPPGRTSITSDALVGVPAAADDFNRRTFSVPIRHLPPEVIRYLLPSRYCDSDKVQEFASRQFGWIINGLTG